MPGAIPRLRFLGLPRKFFRQRGREPFPNREASDLNLERLSATMDEHPLESKVPANVGRYTKKESDSGRESDSFFPGTNCKERIRLRLFDFHVIAGEDFFADSC